MSGDFRAEQGGYVCLDERALPSLSSAATPFSAGITAALAAATKGQVITKVTVCFEGQAVRMTANGTTPTTTVGILYATGTYDIWGNKNTLATMKAIQQAATTTGYYQVWATA
jgi:hypothetical protein